MPIYKGGAIMAVLCKRYKPRDLAGKENCPNCFRWVGIGCENHEALIEDWQTRKSEGIDKVMRMNRAVWIG